MGARLLPLRGLGLEALSIEMVQGSSWLKRVNCGTEGGGNRLLLPRGLTAGYGCQASPVEGSEFGGPLHREERGLKLAEKCIMRESGDTRFILSVGLVARGEHQAPPIEWSGRMRFSPIE
jgi:hypothetical protein